MDQQLGAVRYFKIYKMLIYVVDVSVHIHIAEHLYICAGLIGE